MFHNNDLTTDQEARGEPLARHQGEHQRQEGLQQDGACQGLRLILGLAGSGSLDRKDDGDVNVVRRRIGRTSEPFVGVGLAVGKQIVVVDIEPIFIQVFVVVAVEDGSQGGVLVQLLVYLQGQV